MHFNHKILTVVLAGSIFCSTAVTAAPDLTAPIELKTMGSFAFGGTVDTLEDGTTFHGDHGYAQYYIAARSRHLPIVMWHGIGQSGKTYESTPDGREGFQALLPREDWSVYIVDQPRRGRAGYTNNKKSTSEIPTVLNESQVWEAFRNGPWIPGGKAGIFNNSQFPLSPKAVEQFFRQQTPDTAEEPMTAEYRQFIGRTGAALFDSIGDGILITHSNSGQYGWEIAMEAQGKVKAIIAFEPGACAFPATNPPQDFYIAQNLVAKALAPRLVSQGRWNRLLKTPILIIYGDNIAEKPDAQSFNAEVWRVSYERAKQFVAAINQAGGDAQIIHLPDLGFTGNTHAAFADKNNLKILDLVSDWLKYKGLDGYDLPHQGPKLPKPQEYTLPNNF